MIILLYGQPASGKTTLSKELMKVFYEDIKPIQIDGDKWRDVTKNKDYSKQGRYTNLKGAFDMALYLERDNYTPILSFVTPYDELRKYLYDNSTNLHEIHLCYNEDEDRGRNMNFAKDFEEPTHTRSYLSLNTSNLNIEDCVSEIVNFINRK